MTKVFISTEFTSTCTNKDLNVLVVFREIGKYCNVFQTLRALRVLMINYREISIYHWEY